MDLLIGCGNSRTRKLRTQGEPEIFSPFTLVTLDLDSLCNPDVLHNLDELPYPFADNHFDHIHAYEVLEHCGRQGDWRFFFNQFTEFWRILKPNGTLRFSVPLPDSIWAWGDPGHTRVIPKEAMSFLSQLAYTEQIGKTTMTDYRHCYKADFELMHMSAQDDSQYIILRAVKPSRIEA